MKYVMQNIPYKPNTLVYYMYEGAVSVGKVTDVIIRLNEHRESIEYKVLDIVNSEPRYYFIQEGKLALDLDSLNHILINIMDVALRNQKEEEEDMFNVDKN
jgi:hypothetical protein